MATETTIPVVSTTGRRSGLTSIFRATALLSSTSFLGIAVGLISSKCLAVLIGPSGFGFMGLAQSFLALLTTVAGLGISVAVVREGAKVASNHDNLAFSAIRKAAGLLVTITTAVAFIVLVVFRASLSRLMLGAPDEGHYVVLIGIALAFNVATGIQVSIVNAHHRVKALASISATTTLIGTAVTIACVWLFGKSGIIPAIILGAAAGWIIAHIVCRREVANVPCATSLATLASSSRSLFEFGGTYTLSLLLGTGVQMIMPTLVLHRLGADSVGFYRAAISFSINYLGFLLIAMAQDYYPRVSAAVDHPELLAELINRQQQLILMITLPIVLGALALAPYLVPIIFSAQFAPTVSVLEWHLIGDLFKFTSWTMSYVIMARCKSRVFLFTESVAGVTMVVASWFGMQWFGVAGLGIAFLVTYVIYAATVWIVVRQYVPFRSAAVNNWLMAYGVTAALIVRILPATPLASFRTSTALLFSAVAGLIAVALIRREFHEERSATWSVVKTCLTRFRLSN